MQLFSRLSSLLQCICSFACVPLHAYTFLLSLRFLPFSSLSSSPLPPLILLIYNRCTVVSIFSSFLLLSLSLLPPTVPLPSPLHFPISIRDSITVISVCTTVFSASASLSAVSRLPSFSVSYRWQHFDSLFLSPRWKSVTCLPWSSRTVNSTTNRQLTTIRILTRDSRMLKERGK